MTPYVRLQRISTATLSLVVGCAALTVGCALPAEDIPTSTGGEDDEFLADEPGDEDKAFGEQALYVLKATEAGFSVARANFAKARCFDGWRASCEVAQITLVDRSAWGISLGWPADYDVTALRATLASKSVLVVGNLGIDDAGTAQEAQRLYIYDIWQSDSPTIAAGVFAQIDAIRIPCDQTPCAFYREAKVNSARKASLYDLEFGPANTSSEHERLARELADRNDLIIVGERYYQRVEGVWFKGRTVAQYFTKMQDPSRSCVVSGCNAELCVQAGDAAFSTCDASERADCYYQDAAHHQPRTVCERQVDGMCHWTTTPALAACLADAAW